MLHVMSFFFFSGNCLNCCGYALDIVRILDKKETANDARMLNVRYFCLNAKILRSRNAQLYCFS